MKFLRRRLLQVTGMAAALLTLPQCAYAQAYPTRPVRLIVGSAAGKYSFASGGTGAQPHLAGEQFRLSLNLDLVHVPFNGGGPAVAAVVAGHAPIGFNALTPAVPQIKDGKLRALAVTSKLRSQ